MTDCKARADIYFFILWVLTSRLLCRRFNPWSFVFSRPVFNTGATTVASANHKKTKLLSDQTRLYSFYECIGYVKLFWVQEIDFWSNPLSLKLFKKQTKYWSFNFTGGYVLFHPPKIELAAVARGVPTKLDPLNDMVTCSTPSKLSSSHIIAPFFIRNGDFIYSIGGVNKARMWGIQQSYKWNILTGEWTVLANLRYHRYAHSLTVLNDNQIMATGIYESLVESDSFLLSEMCLEHLVCQD